MLTTLTFFPVAAALLLMLTPKDNQELLYKLNIAVSLVPFVLVLLAWPMFSFEEPILSLLESRDCIPSIGVSYSLLLDGVNLPFLAMLTFLTVVASLIPPLPGENLKKRSMLLLVWEATLIGAFLAQDYVLFLMFWALGTIPIYFLMEPSLDLEPIPTTRCYVLSSLLSIVALGSGLLILSATVDTSTPTISELASSVVTHLDPDTQWWIFLAIFVGCSLRIPLFPFHIWLRLMISKLRPPAGILLVGGFIPLGVYTLLRFALAVLPDAVAAFTLVLAAAGIVNMLFGSLAALGTPNRQHKAAYYVMGYTGTALLGMATLTVEGISGAFYTILSLGAAITFSLTLTYLTSKQITSQGWPLVLHGLEAAQQLRLPGFAGFVGLMLVFPPVFHSFAGMSLAIIAVLFLTAIDYARSLSETLDRPDIQKAPHPLDTSSLQWPPIGLVAAMVVLLGGSVVLGLNPELILKVVEPAIKHVALLLD